MGSEMSVFRTGSIIQSASKAKHATLDFPHFSRNVEVKLQIAKLNRCRRQN